MRQQSLLVLLGLLAGSHAQLLKHLPRIDPSKIAQHRPEDLAKAAKDATKEASNVVDQAQQVANSGDLTQQLEEATESAKKIEETAEGQASTAKESLTDGLDKASNVLDHMSEHVADLDPADMEKTKVSGDSTISDLTGAVKHQSKEEVAGAIRDVTPKVSEVLDRTGTSMADQIIKGTPKAVGLVNRTGDQMAEALHPTQKTDHATPFEDGMGDRGFTPLAGILLVAATAVGGYFVAQRFKTSSSRSPVLLSEALDGVNSRGSFPQGRGGAVQLSTVEEPGFSRF